MSIRPVKGIEMLSTRLSQFSELSLVDQIRKKFGRRSKDIPVGIGDDAAVLKPRNELLLLTTDMMVEGVHFDLRFITAYQLGFKLISVNVSDIYAMGGDPFSVLLNIAVIRDTGKEFIDAFFEGVNDAMTLYRTRLIGGDISSADKGMSLSATLIGYARKCIQRSGAKVGDKIYVTGPLGDSACGLELLKKIRGHVPVGNEYSGGVVRRTTFSGVLPGRKAIKGGGRSEDKRLKDMLSRSGLSWNVIEPLLRRHLMPVARNPKKVLPFAASMIDVSDGLLIDLSRLCDASRVGARIYQENIPMSSEMKETASHFGISPLGLALSGGEDYELLFTAPVGKKVKALHIGDVIKSGRCIVDDSGKEKTFSAEGYQHFGTRSGI